MSLLYVVEDGASAEIAVTGSDGLVGIALFMGGETTPSRAGGPGFWRSLAARHRSFRSPVQPEFQGRRQRKAASLAYWPPIDTARLAVSSMNNDERYMRSRRISLSFFDFSAATGKFTSTDWVAS